MTTTRPGKVKLAHFDTISFFGTKVDVCTHQLVMQRLQEFLLSQRFHHITTPNTEMIMRSRHDGAFQAIINQSDLRLPDGIGQVWFGRWLYHPTDFERVSGADVVTDILKLAEQKHKRVLLLGHNQGLGGDVAERAATQLRRHHPKLEVYGLSVDPEAVDLALILHVHPDIVLVGFGAPRQDEWIFANRDNLTGVVVAMGVGASLDFIVGVQKRAPKWMQHAGLEWLWRLIHQPSRIIRQLAIPYFMWLMLLVKLNLIKNQ